MAGIEPEKIYRVRTAEGQADYAVTPDGVGCYWYDSLAETQEHHGELPVVSVSSHQDFEVLRGNDAYESRGLTMATSDDSRGDRPEAPAVIEQPTRGPLGVVGYRDEEGAFRGVLIHDATDLDRVVQARWNAVGWFGLKAWIQRGIEGGGYEKAVDNHFIAKRSDAPVMPVDPKDARDDGAVRSFHYLDNPAFSSALVVSPWGVRPLEESIYRRWERDQVLDLHVGLARNARELRAVLLETCSLLDHAHEERDHVLTVLMGVDPVMVGQEGVQAVGQRVVSALERGVLP